jgi:hypothetical protein
MVNNVTSIHVSVNQDIYLDTTKVLISDSNDRSTSSVIIRRGGMAFPDTSKLFMHLALCQNIIFENCRHQLKVQVEY